MGESDPRRAVDPLHHPIPPPFDPFPLILQFFPFFHCWVERWIERWIATPNPAGARWIERWVLCAQSSGGVLD